MRVSERLHGFWAWALVCASASIGFQSQATGQIVKAINDNTSPAMTEQASGSTQQWLAKAQQAMAERKLEVAEHYIELAEAMYGQQSIKLNYTPMMARQELSKLQGTPQRSSRFGSALQTSAAMNQRSLDKAIPAKTALLKARQALAHGNVAAATTMVNSAKQYNVDFGQLGDSPARVEAMMGQQSDLTALAKAGDQSFNTKAPVFLLEQADVLLAYNDFETVQMLVAQAEKFPADFSKAAISPGALKTKIASARQAFAARQQQQASAKAEVMRLMSKAQLAFDQNDLTTASELAMRAKNFGIADSEFAPNQIRPWQLELRIQNATKANSGVVTASFNESRSTGVVQADYDPGSDRTKNVQIANFETVNDDSARVARAEFTPQRSRGMQLYRSGLMALDNQERDSARDYFQMAWQNRSQLDATTQQAVQDHLQALDTNAKQDPQPSSIDLESEISNEQGKFRQLQAEVFKERAAAERMLKTNPRQSLNRLMDVRTRIARTEMDMDSKKPLLKMVDRQLDEFQTYIDSNLPEIMVHEANVDRMQGVENRQQNRYDVESQIQKLVQSFNSLLDEQRYAEAEAVARQAASLDPNSEIVSILVEKSKLALRVAEMEAIKSQKEHGFYSATRNAEMAAIPYDDTTPLQFGNRDEYRGKMVRRAEKLGMRQYNSAEEHRIWNLLNNERVQGDYRGSLSDAVDTLSTQAGVNIIFDHIALQAEGLDTSRQVDITLREPVSLRSALNLIAGTAGLVFIVEDEVIKVTSKDAQRKDVKPKTYYVGDLVSPVQNFNQSLNMSWMGPGQGGGMNNYISSNSYRGPQAPLAMQSPQMAQTINPSAVLAQQIGGGNTPFGGNMGFGGNNGYGGGGVQSGTPHYNSLAPAALGGITAADFDPLIDLIKSTIDPESWDDTNGDGTIQSFVSNLSLIVSQTQEVQDQIQDLLQKLRELNDVQIVIEVRFITLRDNFFERIGIDFDFRLNDNSGLGATIPDEPTRSVIVGRDAVPERFQPTQDLDVGFLQNSFASAVPQFGNFDVGTAANFGFAILSDIEVYFLLQASKGDTRSNIMQAPTVTMFNGQSASVSDGAARPFVTSVIPVVGDFAVAQQPVITLLPDGTTMNVQAVVSNDRKSVRMTLVPFFSQIQEVTTFTFDGSTTTRRSSDNLLNDLLDGLDGNTNNDDDPDLEVETSGVTIQLPVIGFTTVNTVVSVPDGGTVLMGGIKRMSEGRTERGVPFLSNVPYINRLFKNVGIGRETSNIMMMVTPRIIIQEEEEASQVGPLGGN